MGHIHRAFRIVIWTLLIISPLPREFAQPTTDMLMSLWNGIAIHPANRSSTHAG